MKRLFALCLAFTMIFSLTGCFSRLDAPSGSTPPGTLNLIPETQETEATQPPEKIPLDQLAGDWMLANDRNDFATLRGLFGTSMSAGNGLSIGGDGTLTYFIGAGAGGTGTFTYQNSVLSAKIVSFVENREEELKLEAQLDSGKLYLTQDLFGVTLTWEKSAAPVAIPQETQLAAPAETVAPTQPAPSGSLGDYSAVLSLYKQALTEQWDRGQYDARGLCSLIGNINDVTAVGYCLRDVDEDGSMELLIGSCNEPNIYTMYKAGSSTMIFEAMERSSYYLEPDNVIVNRCSNSAASGGYLFYFLRNGAMKLNNGIIWDYSVNQDNPYFYTTDSDWNTANDEKISNQRAETAINAYETNYVSLNCTPFAQYNG